MSLTPIADQSAREQALNQHASFIVQAPAGSGKTELLIQRYLTLLANVNSPEEILAITFTKKAASEMRARIMNALQFAALEPMPDSAHQQKTWKLAKAALQANQQRGWSLLENANQCRILTIDALCTYLTSQLPLLAHFGSTPVLADDATPPYREAALEVLQQLEVDSPWKSDLSILLLHLDNDLNKLLNLLVEMLAKRDQWQPYLRYQNKTKARELLESNISLILNENLRDLHALFPQSQHENMLSVLRFCASQLQDGSGSRPISNCEFLTEFPTTRPDDLTYWQAIAECLLTKSDSKWRSRSDKEIGFKSLDSLPKAEKPENQAMRDTWKSIINALSEQETLRQQLALIKTLPEKKYNEQQWEVLAALLNILTLLSAQLIMTFRQHGQIDFIENAQAALTALGNEENPTDLALLLDYQIKHILMDEFQDTSFTQYRLLQMLTLEWQPDDGRTLFIVGDPMQSIYRFRQAEVGLFLRMQTHGINQVSLTPLRLSVNFRSTEVIVDWNNYHFSRIFPSHHDVATGAVNYHPSVSFSNETNRSKTHVTVTAHQDANNNTQAEAVADVVQTLLEEHPEDVIAILVKSRGHLAEILPALKTRHIHYHAVDIDPLIENPLIQDLFSLTRAILHPADRIAWLSVLRSPWCGLSLSDITVVSSHTRHKLCLEQIQNENNLTQLSEDGRSRLRKVSSILKWARYERERRSLRNLIESTFTALDGWLCLTSELDHDIANTYFNCLEDYQAEHLIPDIPRLEKQLERLYANREDSEARVKIMTIHSSKGLEFDSVIIPHLERKNSQDDPALLRWLERTSETKADLLLLAPIHEAGCDKDKLSSYIESQEKIKADYELNRLLYVATTRAKKRLYLHFEVKSKKDQESFHIQNGSFLSKLWPHLDSQHDDFFQPIKQTETNQRSSTLHTIKRLPAAYFIDTKLPLSAVPLGTQQRQGFELPDTKAATIGTLTHRVLQHLSLQGILSWPNTIEAQINLIERLLKLENENITHPEALIMPVIDIVNGVLRDEKGQWILSSQREAQSEYEITYIKQGSRERYILDRTFIDEDNNRWIIDYKTTPLNNKPLAQFLQEEKQKHLDQLYAYHEAMQTLESRPIKLGLYFTAIPHWVEVGSGN